MLNTFSYHLTPGGFIFDTSARALGCAVIPAGPGNNEQQFELIDAYRPVGYSGTPDFLKILLDAAASAGRDVSSIKRAMVSGAAFPPSLQQEIKSRGIDAYQAFGTADLGMVAFETPAREGMVVNEDLILEIVRPGTGDPVAEGDVGEIVVTSLDPHHPWIRLALGDLTAALPGTSPCGRTNMRIKGWMGRADQTTKVKGMFIRPEQIAEIGKRHGDLGRLRLVVTRDGEADAMTLKAECASPSDAIMTELGATLRNVTKLGGNVALVAMGSLPNDGKVICRRALIKPSVRQHGPIDALARIDVAVVARREHQPSSRVQVTALSELPDVFDTAVRRTQQMTVFIEQERRARRVVTVIGDQFENLLRAQLVAGHAVNAVNLQRAIEPDHHLALWDRVDPCPFRPGSQREIDGECGDRGHRPVRPAPAQHDQWLA